MPAAAMSPAAIVRIEVVAAKKLVVELSADIVPSLDRGMEAIIQKFASWQPSVHIPALRSFGGRSRLKTLSGREFD